jgi:DNA-binding HxlR family transcriptional regulator
MKTVRRTSFAGMNCSVAAALEILGEWWTLLVLRDAFLGVRRFEDFQRRLGIARNVLATRLQTLVAHGVLERRRYQERPERYEYRLTDKGLDLYPVLLSLMEWGDRWAGPAAGPPLVVVHRGCGHQSAPRLVCDHCGEPVTARDMQPVTGPGWNDAEEPAPHVRVTEPTAPA